MHVLQIIYNSEIICRIGFGLKQGSKEMHAFLIGLIPLAVNTVIIQAIIMILVAALSLYNVVSIGIKNSGYCVTTCAFF